ncbi:MAG: putative Ig domain-containing protein, partial [Planctomycetes bacterium]|nr:putative Ig domain-containing protein [Planctomycetota bacterium]
TTSFSVEFNPSTTGRKDAQVEFTQSASTPAVFVVKFTGKGTATGGLAITTASLPKGMKGTAYPSTTLTATGGSGALTWSLFSGSLPSGITLSAAGVISGTPTVSGGYSFTVRVADTAGNTDEKPLSITVMQPITGAGGGGGGGCAAGSNAGWAGLAALVLLAAGMIWRRRRVA